MKGIKIDGYITLFEKGLPSSWNTLYNLRELSEVELDEIGIKEVVFPLKTSYQRYSKPFLDTLNNCITFTVIDKPQEEITNKLEKTKSMLIRKFERDTDDLIREVVGERANEYLLAETEAIGFKATGYSKEMVPESVTSDAIANGRTNRESCDLILTMATNWRTIQMALRTNRLLAKAQIKATTLISETAPIKATWDEFLVTLRTQIIK